MTTEKHQQSGKSVHMISLGCPKNGVDAEIMLGSLIKEGYRLESNPETADHIIVNTCGFIDDSKKESISIILEMLSYKEKAKENKQRSMDKKVIVTGCLTQRYKENLVKELPEVDLFVGSGEFQNIAQIIRDSDLGNKQKTFFHLPTFLQKSNTPRVNSEPAHRAYLKISEGCMKRCSFCAIPMIRGNLQSRPLREVLLEAKDLVASGVKEIIIISHDFTDYGMDLRRQDPHCIESPLSLLNGLAEIPGLKWIRTMYVYPDGLTPELIQIYKTHSNIVKYFDIPLQHINDQVLNNMNRKMNRKTIEKILLNLKEELPDAIVRTQFIVGFPGETEEQFQELLEFVKKSRFDHVGCFQYSAESGTPAGKLQHQISNAIKKARYNKLMKAQQKISSEKYANYVGSVQDVVIEGYSEETNLLLQGRMWGQAPDIDGVVLINEGEAQVGDFVSVEILDHMEYDLIGKIKSNE